MLGIDFVQFIIAQFDSIWDYWNKLNHVFILSLCNKSTVEKLGSRDFVWWYNFRTSSDTAFFPPHLMVQFSYFIWYCIFSTSSYGTVFCTSSSSVILFWLILHFFHFICSWILLLLIVHLSTWSSSLILLHLKVQFFHFVWWYIFRTSFDTAFFPLHLMVKFFAPHLIVQFYFFW